jgi:cysteinyl-tRNA synthetase
MELTPFTEKYFEAFLEDMEALGVKPASNYARASEHVDDMVALAARLLERGFAYEKLKSVYFDISRFVEYGKLSGVDLDKIRPGSTVNLDEYEKANPRDFTLFKRAKLSELKRGIYTKTQWGNVRPSWHIQSAAMAMKNFGETLDIYVSSRELMFPHNENEIALSAALSGSPLARYWIHSELVLSGGKKAQAGPTMPYVRDLLNQGYSGRAIRYWLLSHNYHKLLNFSFEALDQATRAIRRLDECIHQLSSVEGGAPYSELDQLLYDIRTRFTEAMDDDLNIPPAMAAIFQAVRRINRLVFNKALDKSGARRIKAAFKRINGVLNIFHFEEPVLDSHVQDLIAQRQEARLRKDWARADEIREHLRAMGVEVKDRKMS